MTETPRQTLSVLRWQSSLDMSRSTLWRALHEDLQARCFKPVRAPRLTTENRLARLNFCRDVLQRVGVLSIRGKRHLQPLDLTRVVFSDEKFFRWNYTGPAQNSPIWVVGAHARPARKTDLDPDVCINEHSQRNPGTMVGAAMVNGIVFPPLEEGVRINTECYTRMLDDVCLPHCMARLGTVTSSWLWQEDNAPSHTSRRTKALLKRDIQLLTWPPCSPDLSPLDIHLWQAWETALGERQFLSQLELRAMFYFYLILSMFVHCLRLTRPDIINSCGFFILQFLCCFHVIRWTRKRPQISGFFEFSTFWTVSVPSF